VSTVEPQLNRESNRELSENGAINRLALRLERLAADKAYAESRVHREREEANRIASLIEQAKTEMESLQLAEPVVTDHALVRYFERVLGFDIAEIKAKILTPEVVQWIDTIPTGKFPVRGTEMRLRVVGRVVVTLWTSEQEKKPSA
jgi:hypothetical protein